ncbi:hypothetical protein ABK040_002426 [Willaertia magna]
MKFIVVILATLLALYFSVQTSKAAGPVAVLTLEPNTTTINACIGVTLNAGNSTYQANSNTTFTFIVWSVANKTDVAAIALEGGQVQNYNNPKVFLDATLLIENAVYMFGVNVSDASTKTSSVAYSPQVTIVSGTYATRGLEVEHARGVAQNAYCKRVKKSSNDSSVLSSSIIPLLLFIASLLFVF